MGAAIRLRLLESFRRGAVLVLVLATLAVAAVAIRGGDTVHGRYGLATDLAALCGYVVALLVGAFPLAIDRERRRSTLAAASPVTPWGWALGNSLGAALVAFGGTFALFAAAGVGGALTGGVETHAVRRMLDQGTIWLPAPPIRVSDATHTLRLVTVSYLRKDDVVGSAEAAEVEVEGRRFAVYPHRPVDIPVSANPVRIRNVSEDYLVGLVTGEIRALEKERAYLPNALGAAVGPALGAAALAALSVAAGAHLSAPVAVLLASVLLLLGAMKGFLLETIEFEGSVRAKVEQGASLESGHDHGHEDSGSAPELAKTVLRGVLRVVPDLARHDRTGRVALGEWTGMRGTSRGLMLLAGSLMLATVIGGAGVRMRRTR